MRRSGEARDRDLVASLPLVLERGLDADRAKEERRGVRSREVFLGKGCAAESEDYRQQEKAKKRLLPHEWSQHTRGLRIHQRLFLRQGTIKKGKGALATRRSMQEHQQQKKTHQEDSEESTGKDSFEGVGSVGGGFKSMTLRLSTSSSSLDFSCSSGSFPSSSSCFPTSSSFFSTFTSFFLPTFLEVSEPASENPYFAQPSSSVPIKKDDESTTVISSEDEVALQSTRAKLQQQQARHQETKQQWQQKWKMKKQWTAPTNRRWQSPVKDQVTQHHACYKNGMGSHPSLPLPNEPR